MERIILKVVRLSERFVPSFQNTLLLTLKDTHIDYFNDPRLLLLLFLLLLLLLTAIQLSLGGSSPYTNTDTTNKNKYT